MQKLLSIAIPSYNAAAYLEHAVSSLLPGGDEVEILVVDDGSNKDNTAELADRLEQEHPGIVRAIHKPNGGHGDAVMTGLREATGLYFKVVDADDWVDAEAYPKILDALRSHREPAEQLDALISNYIYDKVGATHKHVMQYRHALPQNRVFGWDEAHFHTGEYMLMHSVIYRRQLLIDCKLDLPKHTFYVDELYVYLPLPYVKRMMYLDVDFYHYFIGRDDQSVHEEVMIRRIDQALRVNKLMITGVDLTQVKPSALKDYMTKYLEIVTTVSSVLLTKAGTDEHLAKKQELWDFLKEKAPETYRVLRRRLLGRLLHLKGKTGRRIMLTCYGVTQRIYGFN